MDMTNITLTKKYDGLMIINSTIHIEKKYMKKTFQYFKKLLNDNGIIFVILQEGNGIIRICCINCIVFVCDL